MKKKVAHFDRDKCVGCGACVNACLEGAVALVDGKAMLVKEDHCDGLGNCLPNCPVGAITFEERDIPPAAPDGHEHHGHHAHHGDVFAPGAHGQHGVTVFGVAKGRFVYGCA